MNPSHLSGIPRPMLQRLAVLLLAVLQILVTLLPRLGLGEPIGDRSDAIRTLITPAGWAFAIWGPLYAGSLVYALYQALPAQRGDALLGRIGWYAAGAFLGNAVWALYTQSAQLDAVSVAIILFTLLCLLAIYRAVAAAGLTAGERFFVALPLSALAAWLTAAAILNVTAALKYHGVIAGAAAEPIAAAVIVVAGVIAALALWRGRGNPWYALAFLWALAGIDASGGEASQAVAVALRVSALIVVLSTALRLGRARNRRHWFGAGLG